MSASDVIFQRYMEEFQERLQQPDSAFMPDGNQVSRIAAQDKADLDALVAQIGLSEQDLYDPRVSVTPAGLRIHNPLQRLGEGLQNTINRNKKEVCIIGNMALGATIAAIYVASGGTLAVGSIVAGVTINEIILGALAGGASGRGVAEALCADL